MEWFSLETFRRFVAWAKAMWSSPKRIAELEQEVAKLRAAGSQPTQVIVHSGAAYNDFRGAQGTFHVQVPGPAEVVSNKPIQVIEAEAMPAIAEAEARHEDN